MVVLGDVVERELLGGASDRETMAVALLPAPVKVVVLYWLGKEVVFWGSTDIGGISDVVTSCDVTAARPAARQGE